MLDLYICLVTAAFTYLHVNKSFSCVYMLLSLSLSLSELFSVFQPHIFLSFSIVLEIPLGSLPLKRKYGHLKDISSLAPTQLN